MKRVILPAGTKIRTTKFGPMPVETIKSGDLVVSYLYEARRGALTTIIDTKPVGRAAALSLNLLGVTNIILAEATVIVTRSGERKIEDVPNHMIGTCVLNPNQLLTRQVNFVYPAPELEMFELTWDGPEHLLAEGILCGSYDL
jgi:hypothetical protein